MLRWKEAGFLRGRDEGLHLARGWGGEGAEPRVPAEGGGRVVGVQEQLPSEAGWWRRCVQRENGSGEPVFRVRARSRRVEQVDPRARRQKGQWPRTGRASPERLGVRVVMCGASQDEGEGSASLGRWATSGDRSAFPGLSFLCPPGQWAVGPASKSARGQRKCHSQCVPWSEQAPGDTCAS